jgi:hypothetical protein
MQGLGSKAALAMGLAVGTCGYQTTWDASWSFGAGGEVRKYYDYWLARYDMVLDILLSECFSAATKTQRPSGNREIEFWASGSPLGAKTEFFL